MIKGIDKEYIEMEVSRSGSGTSESTHQSPVLVKKVLKREYSLRTFTNRTISYGWVIFPILCYFAVVVGGVMTCISVGNTFAAFDSSLCIFNANLTLSASMDVGGVIKRIEITGINSRGDQTDCLFAEYASAACVLFGGVWIVMVLQCGRGGASRRGFRLPEAWRIVPPTCLGNTIIFIISSIVLSIVNNGYSSFCKNSIFNPPLPPEMHLSCSDILKVHIATDTLRINLVQEYVMAQIGATVQFVGSLIGFLIVIIRCCTGPDFDLYRREEIAYIAANTDEEPESNAEINHSQIDEPIASTSKGITTTVICHHNPILELDDEVDPYDEDDDEKLGSLSSRVGLIQ